MTIAATIDVIYNEDCLQGMTKLAAGSIDMILCDLPYGTTSNAWDTIIPFDALWQQYLRLIRTNGAIVLTSNQRFTFQLYNSRPDLYRYKWVWIKNNATNFINAHHRPMTAYEEVLVFSKASVSNQPGQSMAYYPQGLIPLNAVNKNSAGQTGNQVHDWNRPEEFIQEYTNYPKDTIKFNMEPKTWHPTQKPVSLFSYLIKTYTQPGELVLDNCMGSGTTAIACMDTDRHYVGFERNTEYFHKALNRIKNHHGTQTSLF